MVRRFKMNPTIQNFITDDMTWVIQYEPETKHKSIQPFQGQKPMKPVLICFSESQGIFHKEVVPEAKVQWFSTSIKERHWRKLKRIRQAEA